MPNHVTNKMTVVGPPDKLRAFMEKYFTVPEDAPVGEEPASCLDFDKVVVRPEIVGQTESTSHSNVGILYHALKDEALAEKLRAAGPIGLFNQPQTYTVEDLEQFMWMQREGIDTKEKFLAYCERDPNIMRVGANCVQCFLETGETDWYGWCKKYWGTKWNAYSQQWLEKDPGAGKIVFRFDTAWSPPEPIFKKLAADNPELGFNVTSFDEGWNFAYRYFSALGLEEAEEVKATDALYQEVYGGLPEKFDEDQELPVIESEAIAVN